MSKALDISSVTAQVALVLLKSPAILSDTAVRLRRPKTILKIRKKAIFLGDQQAYYFFQRLS